MASTMDDRRYGVTLGILLGALLIGWVPQVEAQGVDSRWAPWVGCWQAVDETAAAPLLCAVPLAGQAAIEMLTVIDGQVVSRESIFADGQLHAVSREECEGWETAEFSRDSRRIYLQTELTCGAGQSRTSTGVMSWVSPFEWMDVRTMEMNGQSVPLAIRYRLASEAAFRAAGQGNLLTTQGGDVRIARWVGAVPLTLADVIDATENVSAETVKVWIVERGERFALDASGLIEMADAGVSPEVIDVVVAVTYPEKFVFNGGGASERLAEAEYGYRSAYDPFVDPFYDPYSRYGRYYPYGFRGGFSVGFYSGYGYGYGYPYGGIGYGYGGYPYGGYGYGYGGYPTQIIVVGRRGSGPEYSQGQVVPGRGYTSAGNSGRSTGRTARPRSSGSSTSTSAPARSAQPRSSGSSGRAAPRSSGGGGRSAAPSRGSRGSSSGSSSGGSARSRSGRGR